MKKNCLLSGKNRAKEKRLYDNRRKEPLRSSICLPF